jgi:hypothetical protein
MRLLLLRASVSSCDDVLRPRFLARERAVLFIKDFTTFTAPFEMEVG